ncbi:RING [Seminavis robusta]|uniref:RING n=1 Tax=Seminavis robusta TaxID=568900 RepID=A0A9N8H2J2_9STRA|nr:RING [Seminavis robusta]|eukprot:Sro9_g007760.1 RING (606) ;mRNA; r:236339-238455
MKLTKQRKLLYVKSTVSPSVLEISAVMMSKPSSGGQQSPSGLANDSGSATTLDEESFFKSACLETLEDGKLVLSYATAANEKEPLHTGKWTDEEMAYAEGLIDEFREGNLALPDGTSLRQFLAKMLNCSPKRISKRYEGNNYSKGRKFYVKSAGQLGPAEAQLRRSNLQELERRHKQKLLQLKIPHLLIADRSQDDPVDQTKPKTNGKKKAPLMPASTTTGRGGVDQSSVPLAASNVGISDGAGLPASVRGLALDQSIYNRPNFLESTRPSLPSSSLLNAGQALAPSSSVLDEILLSDFNQRPQFNVELLVQLRAQQAESQRLNRLLELQRGLTTATGQIVYTQPPSQQQQQQQQQFSSRSSLLHRDLDASTGTLLGGRFSSLFGTGQATAANDIGTAHIQELMLAEEARTVLFPEAARPLPSSRAALPDPARRASSTTTPPFLSSLVPPVSAASLDRESDLQMNSLIQMQLQAQQTSSSSSRFGQRFGIAQMQEQKINDEDGRQQLSTSTSATVSRAGTVDEQTRRLLQAPPSSLAAALSAQSALSSLGHNASSSMVQQTPSELYTWLQLRTSSPTLTSDQSAGRGLKRKANEDTNQSGGQRRR